MWATRGDRALAPTCLQGWGSPFRSALGMLNCLFLIYWVLYVAPI